MGQLVTKKAESSTPGWWEVSTTIDGASVKRFVSSKFLTPDADFEAPETLSSLSPVHLHTNNKVTRNGTAHVFPLNEAGQPTRDSSATADVKAKQLSAIIKMQNAPNDGQVVIICAQNKIPNRSGHICPVVPETANEKAVRNGLTVTRPLQSQVGRSNLKYMTLV